MILFGSSPLGPPCLLFREHPEAFPLPLRFKLPLPHPHFANRPVLLSYSSSSYSSSSAAAASSPTTFIVFVLFRPFDLLTVQRTPDSRCGCSARRRSMRSIATAPAVAVAGMAGFPPPPPMLMLLLAIPRCSTRRRTRLQRVLRERSFKHLPCLVDGQPVANHLSSILFLSNSFPQMGHLRCSTLRTLGWRQAKHHVASEFHERAVGHHGTSRQDGPTRSGGKVLGRRGNERQLERGWATPPLLMPTRQTRLLAAPWSGPSFFFFFMFVSSINPLKRARGHLDMIRRGEFYNDNAPNRTVPYEWSRGRSLGYTSRDRR